MHHLDELELREYRKLGQMLLGFSERDIKKAIDGGVERD